MLTPHLLKPRSQINAQRLPPGCQHSPGPSLCPPWVTAEVGRGTWGTARALCLLFLQKSHWDKATERGLGVSQGNWDPFTPCPGDFPSVGSWWSPTGPPPRAFSSEHTRCQETPFCRGFVGVLLLISPSSAPHPAAVSVLGSRWDRALAFNAPAGWKGLELGSPSWLPPRSRRLIIAESAASKLIRPKSRLPLSRTCPSDRPHPLGYGVNLPQQSPPCPPGWAAGALLSPPGLAACWCPAAVGKIPQKK